MNIKRLIQLVNDSYENYQCQLIDALLKLDTKSVKYAVNMQNIAELQTIFNALSFIKNVTDSLINSDSLLYAFKLLDMKIERIPDSKERSNVLKHYALIRSHLELNAA